MNEGSRQFVSALSESLRRGLEQGRLSEEDLERILHSPNFDGSAFDLFLAEARRQGVSLPEGAHGSEPPADEPETAERSIDDLERRYLREIRKYPLLTREEEHGLWRAMRAGAEGARRQLILAYLRLVVSLARGYRNRGVEFLDLIEEGNLGLITAVDRFDVDRGIHFSTYASFWIRQSLARGVANQARTVRIPIHVLQLIRKFLATQRRLDSEMGRPPDLESVAAAMGLPVARLARLQTLIQSIHALDVDLTNEAYHGLVEAEAMEQPPTLEEIVDMQIRDQQLDELLRRLPSREEAILRFRYGFYDDRPRTLAEAGERFGLSRERIRQLEQRALVTLRHLLESAEGAPAVH